MQTRKTALHNWKIWNIRNRGMAFVCSIITSDRLKKCSLFGKKHRAYLHHWLSAKIHFNRYNLCFDKYTKCRGNCKPLYFIALHIRVVPLLFSLFVECPLSDTMYWVIGHFRRCVTERLLNTKVVVFLDFLRWFDCEDVFLILIFVSWQIYCIFAEQKCVNYDAVKNNVQYGNKALYLSLKV